MEFENLQIEIPVGNDNSEEKGNVLNPIWEKTYHNRAKSFVVGLDVNSKESASRREKRAKRFGIKSPTVEMSERTDPFQKIDLSRVQFPPVTDAVYADERPESLHLSGVNSMSTKDVFDYFKDHGPDTMEWIDDESCNIVWESERMATTALNAMSRTYDELVLINGEETSSAQKRDEEATKIWRIALPYKKTEFLFLRRSTVKDKKLPGAAKRSLYYLTHGHGNSSKARPGLVTSSRKRKMQQASAFVRENLKTNNPEVQFFSVDEKEREGRQPGEEEGMDIDEDEDFVPLKITKNSKGKELRTRMYADNIENKIRSQDILARVGKEENLKIEVSNLRDNASKWTAGRRNQHKRDGSSSEEESDDEEFQSDTETEKPAPQNKQIDMVRKGLRVGKIGDNQDDLRRQINSSDLRAKIENRGGQNKNIPDLREKLRLKKNRLGLTEEQLNLCIEVTEVSDEELN